MEIRLHGGADLELAELEEPGLDVSGDADGEGFGPLQMFAASLALCTSSVLHGYGHQVAKVSIAQLSIRVRWSYAEHPNRVETVHMSIRWPELPERRREAARRAAETCTIHRTLEHPPEVTTVLEPGS